MSSSVEDANDLTDLVAAARTGLRSDVERLVAALAEGVLWLPLAKAISGLAEGERVAVDGELKLTPQLITDADGNVFCPLFTRQALAEPVRVASGWQTDGGELEVCAMPAELCLQVALEVAATGGVGAVVNPMHESELVLLSDELALIASGRAIPLVGYVGMPPDAQDGEGMLEPATDVPPALSEALDAAVRGLPSIIDTLLCRTFDPERDREPHLTLRLRVRDDETDFEALSAALTAAVDGKVPAPGYLDILFESLDED